MTSTSTLTSWQKKQAALLYFFASYSYLEGLYERVHQLQDFADGILDKSRLEGRDRFLRDARWGNRDTSENWGNNAWSFLRDFGLSTMRAMADRKLQIYRITGANQCARGMAEYSMQWTTVEEQQKFDDMLESVVWYAMYIDMTMDRSHRAGRWCDFGFTVAWAKNSAHFINFPKFRIREDIVGETGKIPPKTGVYMSTDYPDGSLQFAWNGDEYGILRECSIFNNLGKNALARVGRSKLWVDGDAMLGFVQKNLNSPELLDDGYFAKSHTPVLAPSLVARNAFTSAPSKWCYVELVEGEFEKLEDEADPLTFIERRFESGEECRMNGFYFTPASIDSRRYFRAGEMFPALGSAYGKAIWQWDQRQN